MANNKGNPTELNHVEAYVGESDKRLDGGAFFFLFLFRLVDSILFTLVYIYIYIKRIVQFYHSRRGTWILRYNDKEQFCV